MHPSILQQDTSTIDHVHEHGYAILRNVFTRDEAEAAKQEIARLSGQTLRPGRNPLEGMNTNRIYALLNKYSSSMLSALCRRRLIRIHRTRFFDRFCMLPRVLALNDHFLDLGYNLSAFHTIQTNPGEAQQVLHYGTACHQRQGRALLMWQMTVIVQSAGLAPL